MKVLLVNDFYSPLAVGGAETLVTTLAVTLAHRGHEVAICTARTAGLPAHSIDEHGLAVFRIGNFPPSSGLWQSHPALLPLVPPTRR